MEESVGEVSTTSSDEIGLLDIVYGTIENIKALTIIPTVAALIGFGISLLIPPTYIAVTRILPPAQHQSTSAALTAQLGSLASLVGANAGIRNPTDQYVALLRSRSVADAIIQRFNLKSRYGEQYIEDARKQLEKQTKISAGAKDGIISIEVEDRAPERAAEIATAFVEELRKLSNNLAITEAAQRRLFFEEQLKQTKDNLTQSEFALRGSGVSEAALKTIPQSALEALARLKAQITAQEIKLASMRTYMTDSNPELRLAARELAALRAELLKAEQSNTSKVSGDGAQYIAKFRDFKYHEALFELMAKQYELARLDEAREGAVIQVIDEAIPPERRSGPKRLLIAAFSSLAALLMTILVLFVRRCLRDAEKKVSSATPLQRSSR